MARVVQHVLSEEVLDKTMCLFWQRGYFNTSIDDIVATTGFNRSTLYKYYHGKHGLFIEMLKRFRSKVIASATQPLQDPMCGIQGIKDFFAQFLDKSTSMMSSYGCFLISTASEVSAHDKEVMALTSDFIDHLRVLFRNILTALHEKGYNQRIIDSEKLANFLSGNVTGLMTLFRSGASKTIVYHQVDIIHQMLAHVEQGSLTFQ